MDRVLPFDLLPLLEWSALAIAVLWTIGLWSILMGSRRARRFFRGKGYLRPPTGKAWLRFLYYKHYDSFEDRSVRFHYRNARICLFLSAFVLLILVIFLGSVVLLGRITVPPP